MAYLALQVQEEEGTLLLVLERGKPQEQVPYLVGEAWSQGETLEKPRRETGGPRERGTYLLEPVPILVEVPILLVHSAHEKEVLQREGETQGETHLVSPPEPEGELVV